MCGRILGTGPGAVCVAAPGAFAGARSGGEVANEKQFAQQSCTYQMCAVFLGVSAPWQYQKACLWQDLPVTDVGNPDKCQRKHTEGSLQDKLVNITSLAESSGGVCHDLHNIPALA